MATKISYDYGGKRVNNTQEFILDAGETPEAIKESCSIGSTAYRPIDSKKWIYTGNGWTLTKINTESASGGVEQSYVDQADEEVLLESKNYTDAMTAQTKEHAETLNDALEKEIKGIIDNLPTHTLFGEGTTYKHFGIGLIDPDGPSLIETVLGLQEVGLYTVYCDDPVPGNPKSSVSTSAFRGLCHLTQIRDDSKNQLQYGWILLFDQVGHAYTSYIRRGVASEWLDLAKEPEIELVVDADGRFVSGTCNGKAIKISIQ